MWLVSEDGEACSQCGWKPVPRPKPVIIEDADLAELEDDARGAVTARSPEVRHFFQEALHWSRMRNPQNGQAPKGSRLRLVSHPREFGLSNTEAFPREVLDRRADRMRPRSGRVAAIPADSVQQAQEARHQLPNLLRAADIHARVNWAALLVQLGIDPSFVRLKKQGPCPVCNGTDRYTFDNRSGRGDFLCRQCGAGDGFELLRRVHGWSFSEARLAVMEAADEDSDGEATTTAARAMPAVAPITPLSVPTTSIRRLVASSCAVVDRPDAVAYLASRCLWPLPDGCLLRAHVGWTTGTMGRRSGDSPASWLPWSISRATSSQHTSPT